MAKEKENLENQQELDFTQGKEVESLEELIKAQTGKPADSNEESEDENEETPIDNTESDSDEDSSEDSNNSENSDESPIKVFAQMLNDSGLIEYDEDNFEDTDDYLINKYSESVNKRATELVDQIVPDDLKPLFEKYQKGIPLDELIKSESTKVRLDNLKPEEIEDDDDLQEKLVRQKLEYEDFTKSEIDEKIEDYKDNNLLHKEAKSAVKVIKRYEDKRIQDIERQQELKDQKQRDLMAQQVKELKSEIFSRDEIIPGVTMSKQDKEAFYKGITEVGKDGLTEVYRKAQADPDWELKTAYFLLMMDGKLDKVVKKNKTEVTQKFKQNIDKQTNNKFNQKIDLKAIERAFR